MLLPTAALLLTASRLVAANPVYALVHRSVVLVERAGCANPCGWEGWLCCAESQQCQVVNNQATCASGAQVTQADNGYWQYWTSTYVETDLVTKTQVYSSYVGAASQPSPTSGCTYAKCGNSCCGQGQYCNDPSTGQCMNNDGGAITQSPFPPLRPTSSGLTVITATVSPTITVPFESTVPTGTNVSVSGSGGGGLSGGAIAGIVIGVLAGTILLLLICLFCCARAIFDSVLAIFGIGGKRHVREETNIESHHSHAGGAAGGRRWHGQGPTRPTKETKSKLGGVGGAAAILGGLALALGLKRKHDRKYDDKSDYTSEYTYSDYTTSESSASSSDRHTRDTRHTRR
ncbi:hypothetical protein EJ05DRAFT_488170 [Pseudovirgaria hyperparasitica]|uniref:Mid2 domain-containing protein n=1 Tax=Pseudovirgaria hyperparasitica TaxID=470096 RepID=A0A6A6VZX8_9PEZI|nr:uncharacterized protein EJ05DRAFT_488170 [Pseudovirgaria hyperparasitica]KAF2755396.1 hypothetical protein EJ05DRAFT_488170 [Pseudovirgaria hyperparasitica]